MPQRRRSSSFAAWLRRSPYTALCACCAVLVMLLWLQWLPVPPRWNPFAPLSPEDPPNALTRYKLSRLSDNPAACRALLQRSRARFVPAADLDQGEHCGYRDAVRLDGIGHLRLQPSATMNCPMALALALTAEHRWQPAARRLLGQPLTELQHFGTYACRRMNHDPAAEWSEHATANAIDISAFRTATGRQITVIGDWSRKDAAGQFLRAAHDGGCGVFNIALGPDYNAAHRDHFHFDRGHWLACR